MLPVFEILSFTVNILNLISQASPVAITPKYTNERVEAKVGEEFHGVSKINEKGKRKLLTIELLTSLHFHFSCFLILKLINLRCSKK